MKLGIFEIHRLRKHPVSGRREIPWDILQQDLSPATRAIVAKIARSEVKNYVAEQAERAEMPFTDVAGFIGEIKRLGDESRKP